MSVNTRDCIYLRGMCFRDCMHDNLLTVIRLCHSLVHIPLPHPTECDGRTYTGTCDPTFVSPYFSSLGNDMQMSFFLTPRAKYSYNNIVVNKKY